MVQHTKKPAKLAASPNKTPFQPLEAISKSEEKVLKLEREGMENSMQIPQSLTKSIGECAAVCSDNLCASIEVGNHAAQALQNIGGEAMEYYSSALADMVEFSKEAAACRSLANMAELQNKMMQKASDNYLNRMSKLSGMMFDYINQATEPFGARMASTAKHLRSAFAIQQSGEDERGRKKLR